MKKRIDLSSRPSNISIADGPRPLGSDGPENSASVKQRDKQSKATSLEVIEILDDDNDTNMDDLSAAQNKVLDSVPAATLDEAIEVEAPEMLGTETSSSQMYETTGPITGDVSETSEAQENKAPAAMDDFGDLGGQSIGMEIDPLQDVLHYQSVEPASLQQTEMDSEDEVGAAIVPAQYEDWWNEVDTTVN